MTRAEAYLIRLHNDLQAAVHHAEEYRLELKKAGRDEAKAQSCARAIVHALEALLYAIDQVK